MLSIMSHCTDNVIMKMLTKICMLKCYDMYQNDLICTLFYSLHWRNKLFDTKVT